jgi:hypothetical protein
VNKESWRPSASSADYASTLDRYSSMKLDPIDTLVDAFDS